MAKFKLNPEPTFKSKVGIPVPGGRVEQVEFTFKHRTREQLLEMLDPEREGAADETDVQTVMNVAVGWALEDDFNAENIGRLCNNYPGSGAAIFAAYLTESSGARAKN